MITMRVGLSWSDSSRMSSTMGSLRSRICCAICYCTRAPDTWCGSVVSTMLPVSSSLSHVARAR